MLICLPFAGHDGATSQSVQAEQSGAALQAQSSSPPPFSAAEDPGTSVNLAHQSQSVEAVQRQPTVATVMTQPRSHKQQPHEQTTQTAGRAHQPSKATASRPQAANGLRDKKAASSRLMKPWSTTCKGTPGRTGNVLADQYSSVISDSEDSDAEEAQPVSLLRNVDAGSIQSSKPLSLLILPASWCACWGFRRILL